MDHYNEDNIPSNVKTAVNYYNERDGVFGLYQRVSDVKNYDANGNMQTFPDKGISQINYNFLNLPQNIIQNSNSTNYLYRADGTKVSKSFTLKGTTIDTDYLDGFVYNLVAHSMTKNPASSSLRQGKKDGSYVHILRNKITKKAPLPGGSVLRLAQNFFLK